MANAKILVPFIYKAEGGLSRRTTDYAARDENNICPYAYNGTEHGYHTNKGITWGVWKTVFGDNPDSASKFFSMNDEDFFTIFKKLYWDKCLADLIRSQWVGNIIVDWVWGSGQHFPEKDTQEVINHIFSTHIAEDGAFGKETIEAINDHDEALLYQTLIERRKQFFQDIVKSAEAKGDRSQDGNLTGWTNRINNLVEFNKTVSDISV